MPRVFLQGHAPRCAAQASPADVAFRDQTIAQFVCGELPLRLNGRREIDFFRIAKSVALQKSEGSEEQDTKGTLAQHNEKRALRSTLGPVENSLEATMASRQNSSTNLASALSRRSTRKFSETNEQ